MEARPSGLHDVVGLGMLMAATEGLAEVAIGLIDGPVTLDHPDLSAGMVRQIADGRKASCDLTESYACLHGTFVAGILAARRDTEAPEICPGCTILIRPIFDERALGGMPIASPRELAISILDSVRAGARVVNVSAALNTTTTSTRRCPSCDGPLWATCKNCRTVVILDGVTRLAVQVRRFRAPQLPAVRCAARSRSSPRCSV